MAKLRIRTYPDTILSQIAKSVIAFDDDLKKLAANMIDTLDSMEGLGLAAPQVGRSIQLFVCNIPDSDTSPMAIVNPEIVESSGSLYEEEGCLSMPDFRVKVRRAKRVLLRGFDLGGKALVIEAEDLLSRIFQHELDHLNGLLIVNRISSIKRDIFLRKLKKQHRQGV